MPEVSLQSQTRHFASCPNCNNHQFDIGHLIIRNNTWKAACSNCFTNWEFNYKDKILSMNQIPVDSVAGLALVEYKGNALNEKLFFIVEVLFNFDSDGKLEIDWQENQRYYIEEHTCPTNLVTCKAIIHNGDTDPHGVFKYVRAAPIPVICNKYGITVKELFDSNNSYLFHYFNECGAGISKDQVGLSDGVTVDEVFQLMSLETKNY